MQTYLKQICEDIFKNTDVIDSRASRTSKKKSDELRGIGLAGHASTVINKMGIMTSRLDAKEDNVMATSTLDLTVSSGSLDSGDQLQFIGDNLITEMEPGPKQGSNRTTPACRSSTPPILHSNRTDQFQGVLNVLGKMMEPKQPDSTEKKTKQVDLLLKQQALDSQNKLSEHEFLKLQLETKKSETELAAMEEALACKRVVRKSLMDKINSGIYTQMDMELFKQMFEK
jgi:hypothetical protein